MPGILSLVLVQRTYTYNWGFLFTVMRNERFTPPQKGLVEPATSSGRSLRRRDVRRGATKYAYDFYSCAICVLLVITYRSDGVLRPSVQARNTDRWDMSISGSLQSAYSVAFRITVWDGRGHQIRLRASRLSVRGTVKHVSERI